MMKILYIGGAGRSGSTLLEMILGNLPGYFSLGEIRHFWEYIDENEMLCGCGELVSSCTFWGQIIESLKKNDTIDFAELAILNRSINRTRNIPRFMMNKKNTEGIAKLVNGTSALYQEIWDTVRTNYLVDASKNPTQLSLLKKIPDIELKVLHLIRDGRAVSYSWSKRAKIDVGKINISDRMPQRSALLSMVRWNFENIFISKLSRDLPHTILRYEDFVDNPFNTLKSALSQLGIKGTNLNLLEKTQLTLCPTHSIGGNPVRFHNKPIVIKQDNEWMSNLSRIDWLLFSLLGIPTITKNNYKFFKY